MRADVIFLAVMMSASLLSVSADQCPSYDVLDKTVYLPHPYDCTSFVRCKGGQPILARCPAGQHFNPSSLRCDNPAQAHCTARPNTCATMAPESTCPYRCTCRQDNKQQGVCPSKLEFGGEFNVIDTILSPNCDKETNYFTLRGNKLGYLSVKNATASVSACDASSGDQTVPHFGDCKKGIQCKNGQEVTLTCPDGYLLNPDFGYCEEPQYVNCTTATVVPALTDCPQGAAITTCHHDCTCKVVQGICPARLAFTTTINVFDARSQLACLKGPAIIDMGDQFFGTVEIHPNTTKVNHCPANNNGKNLLLPDPSNCKRVFKCEGGKERVIYCPNNQHFNPKTNRCGKPDPAICTEPTLPATATPTTGVIPLDNIPCTPATTCPANSKGRVAHLTDCTLFCQCTQGTPTQGACPPGLHFNAQTQACDNPGSARCKTFCTNLTAIAQGSWSPQSCTTGTSKEGTECRLKCNTNYNLVGSDVVKCTNKGWHGTGGLNTIPSCKTAAEIAVTLVGVVATTLNQTADAAMLFVLDESGSITSPNFEIEKNFVSAMVNAFPLSQHRPAGLITFSDPAATIDIRMSETSTCNFLSQLKKIAYSGGGTNTANALNVATSQINIYASNKKTIVFLISDGQSQTDPVAAARNLRIDNRILFTIGVAGYDRKQLEPISSTYKDGTKLFFGLPNFQVFSVVAEYLRTHYNHGATYNCP